MSAVTLFVLGVLWTLQKEMLCFSFDGNYASTIGIPTGLIHFLQMTCLSFAIVVGIQAVGVVLVSAMLITPAATAYLVRERIAQMLRPRNASPHFAQLYSRAMPSLSEAGMMQALRPQTDHLHGSP